MKLVNLAESNLRQSANSFLESKLKPEPSPFCQRHYNQVIIVPSKILCPISRLDLASG